MISRALQPTWKRSANRFGVQLTRAVSYSFRAPVYLQRSFRDPPYRHFSNVTTTTKSTAAAIDASNSHHHNNKNAADDDITSLILSIPAPYLRNIARFNYDEQTHQRKDIKFDLHNGKIPKPPLALSQTYSIQQCTWDGSEYVITFGDGLTANYSLEWVQNTLQQWKQPPLFSQGRVLWTNLTESMVRQSSTLSLAFDDIVKTKHGMKAALRALYQYGIVLVKDTPTEDGGAGVAALGAAVSGGAHKKSPEASLWSHYQNTTSTSGGATVLPHGTDGPLRTLYGVVWSTATAGQAEGSSVADSAYGHDALPLHTDMCYHRDPPGLQIFTMRQPAPRGGESVFADGFAVANRLKLEHPEAFDTLSTVVRTYYCIDHDTGWHLQASGPIITLQPNGTVAAIRHNDLDRCPDLPPPNTPELGITEFYSKLEHAHEKWDELLSRDEFRLVMSLQPGETVLVANQRCFHGRFDFETSTGNSRAVMGCYISQDDLNSRFRMEGYDV